MIQQLLCWNYRAREGGDAILDLFLTTSVHTLTRVTKGSSWVFLHWAALFLLILPAEPGSFQDTVSQGTPWYRMFNREDDDSPQQQECFVHHT